MAYKKISNRPLKTNGQQYRLVAITFLFKKCKSFDVIEKIPGAFLAFHWFLIVAGDLNQSERYKEKIVGVQGKESL